jgi:integrase
MFRRAKKRADIDNVHFHDARHTAATWMCNKVDVLTLCKIFGWKNTSQALTYYNPKAGDIAKRL